MNSELPVTKAWRDESRKLKCDEEIKIISKNWDAQTWEEYLVATVDVERDEDELLVEDFEALLEESSEGLWVDPLFVPELVRKSIGMALRQLTRKQKEIVWLTFWHEFPQTKIAKKLEISQSLVCQTKIISLNKIKDFLANDLIVASYLIGGSKNFDPKPASRAEQILEIYFQDLKGSYLK